jgi:glucosamine-6-phosphate deaminase
MTVSVFRDCLSLSEQAAADVALAISEVLKNRECANVIFSGAQSQQQFHRALARHALPWSRVHAFSVDEFHAPHILPTCTVAAQPQRDLYEHVPLGGVHLLDHAAPDAQAERCRFERVLRESPPDVACLGVGVSGHVALNEPGATDFNDPLDVRAVALCAESVWQLQRDPNFAGLEEIPQRGLTITPAALMRVPRLFVIVPHAIKAPIVKRLLESPVTPDLPASLLKTKPGARLYLDRNSYPGRA